MWKDWSHVMQPIHASSPSFATVSFLNDSSRSYRFFPISLHKAQIQCVDAAFFFLESDLGWWRVLIRTHMISNCFCDGK